MLPTGGHVVAGGASIGVPTGNTLTITQTTPRAVVNWNSFSVGAPSTVDFNQPSSSAAILNRVTGGTTSTIAGQIDANGQVYLVNPNGIAITSSGSVQVGGGFVASTLGISNQDFMGGNLSFAGNGASAGVSNAGSITAGPGGYVGLIGGTAANSGVISVPLGKVALGSGEAATLDLNGDGFMQVAAPTGATTAKGQALVSNSGKVSAAGGTVELRAATVATAIRDAVNMSGTITATSVSGHDGAITLSGGPGGAVNVGGTLDAAAPPVQSYANAPLPTGNGGAIAVSGARVRVGHHAVLNASGAKGGTVLVGVTAPGGVGEAVKTTIASGAQILAEGDSAVAGSGGYIETSGGTLKFGGATISAGKGGTWLADPTNLTIDATAATTIGNTLSGGTDVVEETTATGVSVGSVGNTSSGAGDIIVDAAISWNTSNTLTLSAFNGITVNAPITVSAGGTLVLTTNNNINGTSSGNGVLAFTLGQGSAQFTGGSGAGAKLYINNGTPVSGNGTQYTLIYNLGSGADGLQSLNGSSGTFALATSLNAATDSTITLPLSTAVVGAFSGLFNGLGNTISNLTINDANDFDVGLFGTLQSGIISNLGVVGGSVTSTSVFVADVGALVGLNIESAISNSYSTAAVSGGSSANVGGLVGANLLASISNSYATGAVSGGGTVGGLVGINESGTISGAYATGVVTDASGAAYVGGLVGENEGPITDAYATGAVSGAVGSSIGGLVGGNYGGSITDAYATGAVSGVTGSADHGGLIGFYSSGTVTDGYYDADTTGMPYDGVTGLHTAQLQSLNLSTGFQNPSNWGIISGVSYPYLTAFYASTPQVISGFAYQDDGVTPLASSSGIISARPIHPTVSVLVSGTSVGSVTTGANGYYYFLEQPGTISGSGSAVLAYTAANAGIGAANAASLISATGSVSGLPIWGNYLIAPTAATTYSVASATTLQSQDSALIASAVGSNSAVGTLVAGLGSYGYIATGASFTVDTPISGANTGLYIQTTAANAPLTVDAPVTIGGANGLTLAASGPLVVNAEINVTGAGVVALGGASIGFTPTLGSLQFTGGSSAGATLAINGAGYTLLYDLGNDATGVQGIDNNDAGNYALATPLTATGTSSAPLAGQAAPFTGNFNGLGNAIANLTINDGSDGAVGLFGQLGSGGTISNIGLVGGSVTDPSGFASIGALAGTNKGTISGAYSTDAVSGGQFANVGGLVGQNTGTISDSFATGSVSSNGNDFTGGLVGLNGNFAGGGGIISDSYATGAVSGNQGYVGGLVGFNINSTITDAYATGAGNGGGSAVVAGLVGQNNHSAITDAYATGALSAGSIVGGLVGQTSNGATITDGYYDTNTTGATGDGGTAVGMATAALQAALPTFQNAGSWGIIAGVSYPYLTAFNPSTPQVISGIAFQDAGVTPLASTASGNGIVSALVGGISLGSVTTGANGYYYFLAPAGTISGSGSAVLTYTTAGTGADTANAASLISATGNVTGLPIWGNTLIAPTAATTYSAAIATPLQSQDSALITSAVGSNSAAATLVGNLGNYGYLATGASFTIDTPINQNAGLYIQTTAANAPLTVDATVAIGGANGLTLDAAGALTVNAAMTVSGAGAVVLDATAPVDNLGFTPTLGSLEFTAAEGSGQTLTINGAAYTLLYTMTEVQNIAGNGVSLAGNYALAIPLNAATDPTTPANWTPVGNITLPFTGNFNGLGNTIANLTINDSTDRNVGLFGVLDGTVSSIGLVGGSVTSTHTAARVGGLVGLNGSGTISNAYTTGAVSAGSGSSVFVGGLVGENFAAISESFATGAVSGGSNANVGGLVGENQPNATITNAYATGAVSGGAGSTLGGLVGNNSLATITDAYAAGAVSGGVSATVGGLVGNNGDGHVNDAYATGAVSGGSGASLGGLVGQNNGGFITDGYYDSNTTGMPTGAQSDGSVGMTTTALQAALPTFQNPGSWSIIPGVSYPFLTAFYPVATPQVISGTAFKDAGVTPLASPSGTISGSIPSPGTVSALVGGASLGSVTTGANGYYYFLAPAGTISGSGSAVLAYTTQNSSSGAQNAASVTSATGSVSGLNILGSYLTLQTADTTYSTAAASTASLVASAVGSNTGVANLVAGLSNDGYLATGASFTVDTPINQNAGLYIQTTAANAPITVDATVTIGGANGLTLDAAGALTVNAAMTVSGAGAVVLDATTPVDNFGLGIIGFTPTLGSLQFTAAENSGQTLTIDGFAYSLLYTMAEVQAINGDLSTEYALAIPLNASSVSSWSPIGGGIVQFSSIFNGLGNTIANLTINDNTDRSVGLFGNIDGTVSNIGLVGGSVTSTQGGATVGGLVGRSRFGTIANAYTTGAVSAGSGNTVFVGGLVGANEGLLQDSYATGAVSGGASARVGGLAGENAFFGTITNAYATGAVSGGSGAVVGGLVGFNSVAVTDAYATGAVTGGASADVGGLVGFNSGTVTDAYATGAVSGGSGSFVSGLVGLNNGGTITDGYYDSNTTGMPFGPQSDGSVGETTAQLQAALPTFQNPGSWGIIPGISYPYLTAFYPSTPQVISGIAYQDAGVTPLASPSGTFSGTIPANGIVSALVGGASLGSVTTGANGYYYFLEQAGTISSGGSPVLAYTTADVGSGAANAASLISATGSVSGLAIWGNTLIAPTAATTYSVATATPLQSQDSALITSAVGSNSAVGTLVSGLTQYGYIATGASFTVDETIAQSAGLYVQTIAANAPITVDAQVLITGANGVTLDASGALTVNALMIVAGPAPVVLDGTSIAFTPTLGSLEFTDTEGSGQTLTINGAAYTLLYNMGEVQGIGLTGNYALAIPLNALTDPTTPASWTPIGSGSPFIGNFNGLGNSISNLTINDTGDIDVGLFAVVGSGLGSGGTVSNIGLIGGSVTGTVEFASVGALVGENFGGTITDAYATAAVSDGGGGALNVGGLVGFNAVGTISNSFAGGAVSTSGVFVGGLVGTNAGAIANSFATGAVSSGASGEVGGLVGTNESGGTITDAYATGPVTGGLSTFVGGLVGVNLSTITDAYATGAVTSGSGSILGGLVGFNNGGMIADGYYDAGTTGMALGPQSDGSAGLTTAQLQSFEFADTANFQNNTNWGIISGVSYPYLTALYPFTPQVVSGTVFQDQGLTPATGGIAVPVLVGGTTVGTATTGANGYYYSLFQPNTIPSGGGVLTYAQNYPDFFGPGNGQGAAFADGITNGIATGLNIFDATLHEITPDSANSILQANLATAAGSDPIAVPLLANLANQQIDASNVNFDIDTPISYPFGTVTLNANELTESAGTITATGLAVNSVGPVDLSGNNAVQALLASVTGSGASFDLVNTQSLLVAGITTNNGAVALQTISGDIDIFDGSINTVNGGFDPSVGFAGVALSAPNGAIEELHGGFIVAPAVVASAANGIDFASFAGPNAFLTFAGQVTGSAEQLAVFDETSLTIGNVSVAAGAGPLGLSLSGVTTNGGDMELTSDFGKLKLDQPLNANNGSTTLGAAPGSVLLFALDDITQSTSHGNDGVIIAGALFAESDTGSVILTAANHIGANDNGSGIAQTAGILAGFADGNFEFVNHDAGLAVGNISLIGGTLSGDCLGCIGIFTFGGNIGLATTGAGAITVNEPINSGDAISIAVASGYGFTNNASDDPVFDSINGITFTSGLDTSFLSAPIVILADGMSLSAGTISAGGGLVVLGPATLTTPVSLGTASTINADGTTSGPLGLAQADIDSITAGSLQIGYRNFDGSVSFNAPIDVASNIQINTNNINDGFGNSTLLLVTGNTVTESGGAITATGPNTLALGVLAGSAVMNQDNAVGTLAAYTDGTNANFSFVNSNQTLAIDTLNALQAGVQFFGSFPIAVVMTGLPSNPLAGITTVNGNVAVTVANSGALAINQPIDAGTGSVTIASVGDLTINPFGSVTGNAITLATLGNFTNNAGSDALTPGASGQWLIYSTNPVNDNDGGLTPSFIQYAATYPVGTAGTPTSPAASGNGFLYSIAPTVTVNSVTKIYDGTTNLPTNAADYTIGGGFNGDSVTLVASGATGSYASANVGSGIDVTLTGLTIGATNAGGIPVYGYGVIVANGGAIGTITPATLTASIVGNPTKVYDGTTTAALASGNFSLSGFVAGQGATVSALTGAYNSADVASATMVTASLAAGDFSANAGTNLGNYTLPTTASGAGAITRATLTASIVGNPTKVYDGTTTAALASGNFSLSGFVAGQGATVSALTGAYNSADVATATTVSVGLTAGDFTANAGTNFGNYTLPTTASGAGSITPATLTASIVGTPTKVYDGTTAAALASGNFSLSGFVAGQGATVSALTGVYNSADVATATTVTASLTAGDFSANAGTNLGNYTLPTTASGAGAITPANLTITADNATKVYGTTLSFAPTAFTSRGLISGDTITGVTLASVGAAAAAPVAGSPYAITATGATGTGLSNYAITYLPGTLMVTPAPLTIAADDLTRLVGLLNPPLGYAITSGSLFNGDTLSGMLVTSATPGSPIGAYAITQGTLAASRNYSLAFIDGVLTIAPVPNNGVSPVLFVSSFLGTGGPTGGGSAFTTCSTGSIAAQLKASGKVSLYGGGGGACGGL